VLLGDSGQLIAIVGESSTSEVRECQVDATSRARNLAGEQAESEIPLGLNYETLSIS